MPRRSKTSELMRLELPLPADMALALLLLARKSGLPVQTIALDLLRDSLGSPATSVLKPGEAA